MIKNITSFTLVDNQQTQHDLLTQALDPEMTTLDIELHEHLEAKKFVPSQTPVMYQAGWSAPISDDMVVTIGGNMLFKFSERKRNVPAAMVNDEFETAYADKGLTPSEARRAKVQIKEALAETVPPITVHTWCWWDTVSGMFYVDTASAKQAETVLTYLRKTLGSFPAEPMSMCVNQLTAWLSGESNPLRDMLDVAEFRLGSECAVTDDGSKVAFTGIDLPDEEVQRYIDHRGFDAMKTGLVWQDQLSFVLNDAFVISKLTMIDAMKADADGDEDDDTVVSEFALLSLEIRRMMNRLIPLCS